MAKIIKPILFLISLNIYCQSKDSTKIYLDDRYIKSAENLVRERYEYTREIEDDSTHWNWRIPLSKVVKYNDLSIYSIPVFELKKQPKYECSKDFTNYINFEVDTMKQQIVLAAEKKFISSFSYKSYIDLKNNKKRDKKFNALSYEDSSKSSFIGSQSSFNILKSLLEKDYFRFNIKDLEGTFVVKDNKIYHASFKSNLSKRQKKRLEWQKVEDSYKLELIEINNYIRKNLCKEMIHLIQNTNYLSFNCENIKKRSCRKKCLKQYTF